jgi:predicted dehydrogenase
LRLNRADFYRNEVSFQVSCSYGRRDHAGPGSAQDNFRRVLAEMAAGRLPVEDLITHRFPFRDAVQAYATLQDRQALGILLEYDTATQDQSALFRREVTLQPTPPGAELGLLGAGNFAVRTLLPALERGGNRGALAGVVSREGLAAVLAARKFGAGWAGTDPERLWQDQAVKGVFITTRHDAHAEQALAALRAGKHVWVEKPLAIDGEALRRLEESLPALGSGQTPVLMVGFNRRFAPLAVALRRALAGRRGPHEVRMVINAGRLDPEHWALDPRVGGGRIVGEACHFVDLARFLVAAPIVSAQCRRRDTDGQDGGAFELRFAGGSVAVIDYRTDLPAHLPKERIEVSGPGYAARLENWARLRTRGLGGLWRGAPWARTPQKGHPEALAAFRRAMGGGGSPIPTAELLEVSWWAIRLQAMRADEVVTAP